MKLLVLLLFLGSFSCFGQDSTSLVPKLKKKNQPAKVVCLCDIEPEFPGGWEALNQFIQRNISSLSTKNMGALTKHTFYVDFTITELGTIENIKVLNLYDEIAVAKVIRFFNYMPDWSPYLYGDTEVSSRVRIPITFILGDPRYHG